MLRVLRRAACAVALSVVALGTSHRPALAQGAYFTSSDGHVFKIEWVATTLADGVTNYYITPGWTDSTGRIGSVNGVACQSGGTTRTLYADLGGTNSFATEVSGTNGLCRKISPSVTLMATGYAIALQPNPFFKYRVTTTDADRQDCTIYIDVSRTVMSYAYYGLYVMMAGNATVQASGVALSQVASVAYSGWMAAGNNSQSQGSDVAWYSAIVQTHSCVISGGTGYFLVNAPCSASAYAVFGGYAPTPAVTGTSGFTVCPSAVQ